MDYKQEGIVNLLETKRKVLTICVDGNIGSGKTTLIEAIERRHRVNNLWESDDGKNATILRVLPEPVTTWTNYHGINMLEAMYADPKANSFEFQVLVYVTMRQRHSQLLEYIRRTSVDIPLSSAPASPSSSSSSSSLSSPSPLSLGCKRRPPTYIYERCLQSALKVFIPYSNEKGNYSAVGKRVLDDLYNVDEDVYSEFLPSVLRNDRPDILVYLKTSPSIALERVRSRGRANESPSLTIDMLSRLDVLYDAFINEYSLRGCSGVDVHTRNNTFVIELNGDATPEDILNEYVNEVEKYVTFYMCSVSY